MTLFEGAQYSFREASEPWMPFWNEILYRRDHGSEEEQERYAIMGLDRCDWGSYLADQKDELVQLFDETYAFRRVGSETLEQEQWRIQRVLDTVAPRYARAFALYAANEEEMQSVLETERTTYDNVTDSRNTTDGNTHTYGSVTDTRSTTDDNTHTYVNVKDATSGTQTDTHTYNDTTAVTGSDGKTVKVIDTPDSAINESDSYADSFTKETDTKGTSTAHTGTVTDDTKFSSLGKTRTGSETDSAHGSDSNVRTGTESDEAVGSDTSVRTGSILVEREPAGGILKNLNENIAEWRNLAQDFVREFNKCFMNVFWY